METFTNFTQNASKFAFKNGLNQKTTIDIYPLDPSNHFKVNSSIVNHIDYETNGFKIDDLKFTGWCIASTIQNKRKNRDENDEEDIEITDETANKTLENFYVNVFAQGEIVTYSSNGKDIVNLIRNKKEILGICTVDDEIWTLDEDKCVKIYQYNIVKPKKTFTLIDGKADDIINFQLFKQNDNSRVISIITENVVYLIDPTKRRPNTIAKFDISNSKLTDMTTDLAKFLVTDTGRVKLYEIGTNNLIKSWELSLTKIKFINNELFCALDQDGVIQIFNTTDLEPICEIKAVDTKCLDFVILPEEENNNRIVIAWLNVNEPNFKLLTIDNIIGNKEITINEEIVDDKPMEEDKIIENHNQHDDTNLIGGAVASENRSTKKKISSKEKNEIVNQLTDLLQIESQEEAIIANITLDTAWNEPKIIWFINNKLTHEDTTNYMFQTLIDQLQSNIWHDTKILNQWFKWLITLKNLPHAFRYNKKEKKQLRHFKTSLKTAKNSVPVLLGIQGKLELLVKQNELREQLNQLDLTQENEVEEEESVVYVDGENDVFVDAHM